MMKPFEPLSLSKAHSSHCTGAQMIWIYQSTVLCMATGLFLCTVYSVRTWNAGSHKSQTTDPNLLAMTPQPQFEMTTTVVCLRSRYQYATGSSTVALSATSIPIKVSEHRLRFQLRMRSRRGKRWGQGGWRKPRWPFPPRRIRMQR